MFISSTATAYVTLVEGKNGNVQMLGFEGKLFSEVTKLLNLTIRLIVSNHQWGVFYPNNTFTGAFGMVIIL